MTWVQTYTGKRFELLVPRPDLVDLEDIAHALSLQNRFNGHTRRPYNVAQHSVLVARAVDHLSAVYQLQALMHDAAEAYIGDLVRPVKMFDSYYVETEAKVWAAVCEFFELPVDLHPDVKVADNVLLSTEARDLFSKDMRDQWEELPKPLESMIVPWSAQYAEQAFKRYYWTLRRLEMKEKVHGDSTG